MKVLVTGGSGFIGSNFVRHILASRGPGVSVVNLDKMTYAANPANLADVENLPNYKFIRGDIADPDVVRVIAAKDFFQGIMTTALQEDELLSEV